MRGGRWKSILVRTGVFRGEGNHDKHPAWHVCDDVTAAVREILRVEGVKE